MKKQRYCAASAAMIMIIVGCLLGVALGVWLSSGANTAGLDMLSWTTLLFLLLWTVLATVLHELGHLLMGWLTGYKFVLFNVFGVTFFRKDGRWHTAREKLRGAIGQCVMQPDFEYTPKMPVFFYNAGGVIFNLLFALLCLTFMLTMRQNEFALAGLVVNGVFFLINAIPSRGMQNDGHNVLMLMRSQNCKKAFYLQLKLSADTYDGKDFDDMPQSYFDFAPEDLKYPSVCTALYVCYCYRVSVGRTQEASALIKTLYDRRAEMPVSHANTISVEYFNNLVLFCDDRPQAAAIYNGFDAPIKNAIHAVPVPFAITAKILVNALSSHNDAAFYADCRIADKLIETNDNAAEAQYARTIVNRAKQCYNTAPEDPFEH